MSSDINVLRKYYTVRGCLLETDEYYSSVKNQTFQQNSFFVFSAPRVIMTAIEGAGAASIEFFGTVNLTTDTGKFTFIALDDEDLLEGTFTWSLNGTAEGSKTSNPTVIFSSDLNGSIIDGLNVIEGTFTPDSGTVYSFTAYWENSWEKS